MKLIMEDMPLEGFRVFILWKELYRGMTRSVGAIILFLSLHFMFYLNDRWLYHLKESKSPC